MRRQLAAAAILLGCASPALAQRIEVIDAATLPRFDVVSVKPGDPLSPERAGGMLAGRYLSVNETLENTIAQAFGVERYQLPTTLPDIAGRDIYAIEARIPPGTSRQNVALMLRALLVDRFKLQVHVETREDDGYSLVLARPGGRPAERLLPVSDCASWFRTRRPLPPVPGASTGGSGCGLLPTLASFVASALGRPVKDRTGLEGLHGYDLRWSSRQDAPDAGPSLTTAVQEQLGLRLEPVKMQVDHLVIDHIERPDAN